MNILSKIYYSVKGYMMTHRNNSGVYFIDTTNESLKYYRKYYHNYGKSTVNFSAPNTTKTFVFVENFTYFAKEFRYWYIGKYFIKKFDK